MAVWPARGGAYPDGFRVVMADAYTAHQGRLDCHRAPASGFRDLQGYAPCNDISISRSILISRAVDRNHMGRGRNPAAPLAIGVHEAEIVARTASPWSAARRPPALA